MRNSVERSAIDTLKLKSQKKKRPNAIKAATTGAQWSTDTRPLLQVDERATRITLKAGT